MLGGVIAALVVAVGARNSSFVLCSYDWIQLFKPVYHDTNLVVVYLSEPTDRLAHARVIDYLNQEQAKLIVVDIFLQEAGSSVEDLALAGVLDTNVVLAAEFTPPRDTLGVLQDTYSEPHALFLAKAAGSGLAGLDRGPDGVVRKIWPGLAAKPSLPWLAAQLSGVIPTNSVGLSETRWLNYYGQPLALDAVNTVTNQPMGYFKDKFVFIGAQSAIRLKDDVVDIFATPFTRPTGQYASGVDLLATSFCNLLQDDWMRQCPTWLEFLCYVVFACAAGYFCWSLKNWHMLWMVPVSMLGIMALALYLAWEKNMWFPWTIPAFDQLPCMVVLTLLLKPSVARVSCAASTEVSTRVMTSLHEVMIPDHTLLHKIDSGGYGDVWLAENTIGLHHAVKIVYRNRFDSAKPYEREFKGIQSFMPVSRMHSGLVDILHVGRNDRQEYFYYVMEVCDDVRFGPQFEPGQYQPRTLAYQIRQEKRLPPKNVQRLMITLCEALDYLHQQNLVHRDIKPANIIYVNGGPKLADIGLVTQPARTGDGQTIVGTKGFMLMDAPGTVENDLYALGKVIYVCLTGLNPDQFPELPMRLEEDPDFALLGGLNEIAWKACGLHPRQKYQNAAQVRDAIMALR